jgi:hypothetical protein
VKDCLGDAWASHISNRLRAEKFKKRIFADYGIDMGIKPIDTGHFDDASPEK